MSAPAALDTSAVPVLPRGVRMQADRVRGGTVLLGPERVLLLDEIGVAILTRVDGRTAIGAISADLARTYDAPEEAIRGDVIEYLSDLAGKRLVERTDG